MLLLMVLPYLNHPWLSSEPTKTIVSSPDSLLWPSRPCPTWPLLTAQPSLMPRPSTCQPPFCSLFSGPLFPVLSSGCHRPLCHHPNALRPSIPGASSGLHAFIQTRIGQQQTLPRGEALVWPGKGALEIGSPEVWDLILTM